MKPLIFLNFKTYQKATGEKALKLAKIANRYKNVFICLQDLDIHRVSSRVKVPVFAQHAESFSYGSHTGHVTIGALKQAGAKGAMINHSENRIPMGKVKAIIKHAKKLKFPLLVCVKNLREAKIVNKLKPKYIAYEPPKLIGSGKSVTEYTPYNVHKFCKIVNSSIPLVGAGISNQKDVKKALELGAKGVLLASAFVKSKDPKKLLKSLTSQ